MEDFKEYTLAERITYGRKRGKFINHIPTDRDIYVDKIVDKMIYEKIKKK